MGYTTEFTGQFKLNKQLSVDDNRWLTDFSSERHDYRTYPGIWCQWVPTEDGQAIEWNGAEKFYSYTAWLQWLIEHFFAPRGYVLNGEVEWDGEERGDVGKITVKDNQVSVSEGRIAYAGSDVELSDEVQSRLDNIPGDEGFWSRATQDIFYRQAKMLLSKGLTEVEVIDHLATMYHAVGNEYGN